MTMFLKRQKNQKNRKNAKFWAKNGQIGPKVDNF